MKEPDDILDQANERVKANLAQANQELAEVHEKVAKGETTLYTELQRRKTTKVVVLDCPLPYGADKSSFNETDVEDYLKRLEEVCRYLFAGMPLEENIRVNIFDWEDEESIEQKVKDGILNQDNKQKELKELRNKKDLFFNLTFLSCLGWIKSEYNGQETIPQPLEEAVKMARTLAFRTVLETVRIYNPTIQTEEDFNARLRLETVDQKFYQHIDLLSQLFTEYFSKNPEAKEKFKKAMLLEKTTRPDGHVESYGMDNFLEALEWRIGLPDSVSKVPNYLRILEEKRI